MLAKQYCSLASASSDHFFYRPNHWCFLFKCLLVNRNQEDRIMVRFAKPVYVCSPSWSWSEPVLQHSVCFAFDQWLSWVDQTGEHYRVSLYQPERERAASWQYFPVTALRILYSNWACILLSLCGTCNLNAPLILLLLTHFVG